MSFINYTDVAISLDGASVFASSASINNSLSMSPVRAVGIKGAAGMIPDGPATAECSIDLVGGAGYTPKTDLSNAANCETALQQYKDDGLCRPRYGRRHQTHRNQFAPAYDGYYRSPTR